MIYFITLFGIQFTSLLPLVVYKVTPRTSEGLFFSNCILNSNHTYQIAHPTSDIVFVANTLPQLNPATCVVTMKYIHMLVEVNRHHLPGIELKLLSLLARLHKDIGLCHGNIGIESIAIGFIGDVATGISIPSFINYKGAGMAMFEMSREDFDAQLHKEIEITIKK